MRIASLVVVLLAASLLWAQEAPSAPPSADAAQPAEPAPPPEAAPSAPAAPQLGHPLDPADVATLTGRAATSAPAYTRTASYGYPLYNGGYPADIPLFGGGQFSGSNWAAPMFSPFGFGMRRNLFFFGHTGFAPPLFVPLGGGSVFVGFRPHHGGGHHH